VHAAEYRYPEFAEGQVLTHNDLNLLRDFLYSRSALQNRMLFGFGVACGLEGTVAGANVQFSPGIALGQGGRELVLETASAPVAIAQIGATGSSAIPTITYTGVTGTPGGFTPILRAADAVAAAGGTCDEDGCTTHTEVHTLTAEIVWARGQLGLSGPLNDAIMRRDPLVPPSSQAQFEGLRTTLATFLTGKIGGPTLAVLTGLNWVTTGATAEARNLLRIGVLNEVLYTIWAYQRCLSYTSAGCLGVAAADPLQAGRPGVALGWLHQETGGAWTFEKRFRHEFQLSRSLYYALQASGPGDPCQRYLDHIRVLLQNYEEPAPPATGTPPDDPPDRVDVCVESEWRAGRCGPWWREDWHERFPYEVFLVDPSKVKKPPEPRPGERFDFGDGTREKVTDILNAGLVRTTPVLFTDATKAQTTLVNSIREQTDVTPKVRQVTTARLEADAPGFQTGLVVSAADDIVLVVGSNNAVVKVGSVPAGNALADVSGVPGVAARAETQAGNAVREVSRLEGVVTGYGNTLVNIQRDFANVQFEWRNFQTNMPREEVLDRAGEMILRVEQFELRTQRFERDLTALQKTMDSRIRKVEADTTKKTERLRGHFNTTHNELLGMVRENRHRVERQRVVVDRLDKETSDVRDRVDSIGETTVHQLSQIGGRLDTQAMAIRTGMTGADVARAQAVNQGIVAALDKLSKAAMSAAPRTSKTRVTNILKGTDEAIVTLSRAAGSPLTLTELEPTALFTAMETIVMALEAGGSAAPEVSEARVAFDAARRSYGGGG
jgi:hypothetical protein